MTRTQLSRLKRQQARRQAIFLVAGCALVVGVVFAVFALTSESYPGESRGDLSNVQTAGEVVENSQSSAQDLSQGQAEDDMEAISDFATPPLSLGVGGDVTFGLAVKDVIGREGSGYPWEEIAALIGGYDLTVVNLEGPLCRGSDPNPDQSSVLMRGDSSCAAPMAAAGVNAVCLANDHIMDYGSTGLQETLSILRGDDLDAFGAGSNSKAAEKPLILEADNGASVALISFCDVAPATYSAGEDTPGISAPSRERLGEMVREAGENSPYVVAFLHWGEIGSTEITTRQRELARICVEAGADLVVGCHPHVVQGIEVLQGVPVIYSLGNLVFSSESEEGKTGIFAACRFSGGVLDDLEIFPLRVEGARPVRLSGQEAEKVLFELGEASPGIRLEISPHDGAAKLAL